MGVKTRFESCGLDCVCRDFILKERNAAVECLVEVLFLSSQRCDDGFLPFAQLGKYPAEVASYHVHELVEEWFVKSEIAPISNRPAKDTTQDVAATFVGWRNAIGNRKAETTDVVGDDAEGDVHFALFARIIRRQGAGALLAAQLLQLAKDRAKNVGFIIGDSSLRNPSGSLCTG